MTMLGSATIVGQSAASALTGAVAESSGSQTAMWLPVGAAAFVLLAAVVNALTGREPGESASPTHELSDEEVRAEARTLAELPTEHL